MVGNVWLNGNLLQQLESVQGNFVKRFLDPKMSALGIPRVSDLVAGRSPYYKGGMRQLHVRDLCVHSLAEYLVHVPVTHVCDGVSDSLLSTRYNDRTVLNTGWFGYLPSHFNYYY
jgi:hypothetical protein